MHLEERIKATVEQAFPIRYTSGPGYEKDCRHKIARQEMLRRLRTIKIREEVVALIQQHQTSEIGIITKKVNEYFTHYFEKDHH